MKKALLSITSSLIPRPSSLILFFFLAFASGLFAQASLSIQGILKKSNGVAVDDGVYTLTFKLYTAQTGGTAIWDEEQTDIEVSSGMYSATLGTTDPLTVPFNQLYYLGITIGSTELTPRIQLTSAPYALSLIGVNNQFPSSGQVIADEIKVNGGVLAQGGAPGANGVDKNGYAFSGNSGDNDSGLFSTAGGQVALYANNTNIVNVTTAGITVTGNVTATGNMAADNLTLTTGGSIKYNTLSDWRLVDVNDFEIDAEGWKCYDEYNSTVLVPAGTGTPQRVQKGSPTNTSYVLRPSVNAGDALRKQIDLTGIPHNYVRVKFTVFLFNSFDPGEAVYAAFAADETPNYSTGVGEAVIGWSHVQNGSEVIAYWGATDQHGYTKRGEMEVKNASNTIYLIFDSTMNGAVAEENYGISNIEIWVK